MDYVRFDIISNGPESFLEKLAMEVINWDSLIVYISENFKQPQPN